MIDDKPFVQSRIRIAFSIMDQAGHRRQGTLKKCIRKGSLFKNNAAAQVGL